MNTLSDCFLELDLIWRSLDMNMTDLVHLVKCFVV